MFDDFVEKYFTYDFQSPCFSLYTLNGPALILLDEKGMWFQNQVDGGMCQDVRMRGILVPLVYSVLDLYQPEYWLGTISSTPDEEYDAIEKDMNQNILPNLTIRMNEFKVERECKFNTEAYILCSLSTDFFKCALQYEKRYAILTWENSD